MRVCVYSTKPYDREFLTRAGASGAHSLDFLDTRLTVRTAGLAAGADAVCVFVNDVVDAEVIGVLAGHRVRLVALRCAGFNNVDLAAAAAAGVAVVRVPAYSPHAVAEHTLAMILCLDRQVHRAYQRVRDHNFSLEGLLGFDLHGRTAGVIGTGRIGCIVARLLGAFGCAVLAHDPVPNPEAVAAGVRYVELDRLLVESDVITLTCPLTPGTHHLIDDAAVARMKPGVMLVNTGRGALVDTGAVVEGLKSGRIGSFAADVYEEEAPLFYEDRSSEVMVDDLFARLLTFPNVLVTAHQGFFTADAMTSIAGTTISNLDDVEAGRPCVNEVTVP
jgi:D-lactate dehydrogenase